MLFEAVFQSKSKSSTYLWWYFFVFGLAESQMWLPGSQSECGRVRGLPIGRLWVIYDRLERLPAAPWFMALLLVGSCAVIQELATPVVIQEALFTATNRIADGRVLSKIIIYNSEKNCELFYFSRFFLLFICKL
jgi:hypothetical protein